MNEEHGIPNYTLAALKRYLDNGIPPGHFLTAVLENNLVEAETRADIENSKALKDIIMYVYWEMPSHSWGSPEKVARWIKSKEPKEAE
ncbi:hypothetical protein LCGC14_2392130 [marine sediment metagenome]|uniref:Uncharacterized protein n=1 Tax=marine sediment metagenome TaxID=412755 RepID=A0A0F9BXX1_9ZZZZ